MRISYILILFSVLFFLVCCRFINNRKKKRDLSHFERIARERTDDLKMEEFIDSLIDRMELVEKIGQMTQVNESFFNQEINSIEGTGRQATQLDTMKVKNLIREYQVGAFLSGGKRSYQEWIGVIKMLQEINLNESKSRIPIIFGIDHIHGTNYIAEGIIYPHQINIAATFNPSYSYQMGKFTAMEAAPIGHHWNFAPVLDLGVNKLWPRLYETFGEDTHLSSTMGEAYIRGLQETTVNSRKMAACAKHFLGYSYTQSGWDRGEAVVSVQALREMQVPIFKKAIEAGVMSVMVNSGDINGIPVHASYDYLTGMLRDELGFQGVVITDFMDIIKLHTEHFVTETEKESTFTAIMAGIDMSMTPTTVDFCRYLHELVLENRIPEERLDLSLRRILRLKYRLGLFENPYPVSKNEIFAISSDAKESAEKAAGESIVLMKNSGRLLPLIKPARLVVTGKNAILRMALTGGWTYSWQGHVEKDYPDSMLTVFTAIQNEFDNATVIYADRNSLAYQARSADAVIVVTGELPYAEGWGNLDDLTLPEEEMALTRVALETGKPVVLILLEGRPRIIAELFDQCRSVIFAGLPGMFGGQAIAGILSGRVNPSGKMPITYPYQTGHIIPYNYKPMEFSYLNVHNKDIQRYTIGEFGSGLSYTQFEYSDLILDDSVIFWDETLSASLRITNRGQREGFETALWFVRDEVGKYTRPVKQLKHYEKMFFLPGESKELKFLIEPSIHLTYPDELGNLLSEDGYYILSAGNLSNRFRVISR